ncbi:uncharacterized protein BDW70DRAFT_167207 [Aspergillus foveolatus]|uniref:uncharacterized protein n=1 Tax=Aspergillus foveolatus TaxID=210207 RepID=UPI003CCD73BD
MIAIPITLFWLFYPPLSLFFLCLSILILGLIYRHSSRLQHNPHHYRTAASCRAILDGSRFPDSRKNQLEPQTARAIPNHRLQRVFGIENAFTTGDKDAARLLVRDVKTLITESDVCDDWNELLSELYRVVLTVMEETEADAYVFRKKETGTEIDVGDGQRIRLLLAPMVRALTLRVLLWVLFCRRNGGEIQVQLLINLGDSLHKTRIGMMTADEGGDIQGFRNNHDAQSRLAALFPDWPCDIGDGRSNPLSLLLHGFEALWPVILRMFFIVHSHNDEDWKVILTSFIQKPTLARFRLCQGKQGISAEHLVKEALRLYPPIRQIQRAFQFPASKFSFEEYERVTATADIEFCHIDPKVWGSDSQRFRPRRWKRVSVVQNLSFLALGSRPFLCAADSGSDFGLRVVGFVVGVLLDVFGDGNDLECVLGSADMEEMREISAKTEKRLRNELGCYQGVYVEYSAEEAVS